MKKYFFGDFVLVKALIVNKIAMINFLKDLSFKLNFKQNKMYKINTHKINSVRKIRPKSLLKSYNDEIYIHACIFFL